MALQKQFAALGVETDAERIAREAKEALKPKKPIEIIQPAKTATPEPISAVVEPIQPAESLQTTTSINSPEDEEAVLPLSEEAVLPLSEEAVLPLSEEATAAPTSKFQYEYEYEEGEPLVDPMSTERPTYDYSVRKENVADQLGVSNDSPKVQAVVSKEEQGVEDDWSFYDDVSKQIAGGFRDAAEQVTEVVEDVTGWDPYDFDEVERSDTISGNLIREVSRFGLGFGVMWHPAGMVVRGLAGTARTLGLFRASSSVKNIPPQLRNNLTPSFLLSGIAQSEIAGIAGEQLVYDPTDPRIADIVEDFSYEGKEGVLSNAITEYLQSDPNDSQSVARFKLGVESSVVSGMAYGLFKAISILINAPQTIKVAKNNKERSELVRDAAKAFEVDSEERSKFIAGAKALRPEAERLGNSNADDILLEFQKSGLENNLADFHPLPKDMGTLTKGDKVTPAEWAAILNIKIKDIKLKKKGILSVKDVQTALGKKDLIGNATFQTVKAKQLFLRQSKYIAKMGGDADDLIARLMVETDISVRALDTTKVGSLEVSKGFKITQVDVEEYLAKLKSEQSGQVFLNKQRKRAADLKLSKDSNKIIAQTSDIDETLLSLFRKKFLTPFIDFTNMFQRVGEVFHGKTSTSFRGLAKLKKEEKRLLAEAIQKAKKDGIDVTESVKKDLADSIKIVLDNQEGIANYGKTLGISSQLMMARVHALFQGKILGKSAKTLTDLSDDRASVVASGAKSMEEFLTPILKAGQGDNFALYAASVSSLLREEAGNVTHIGTAVRGKANLEKVIKELESIDGFKEALHDMTLFTDTFLDDAVASGLMSRKEAIRAKRINPVYAPLQIFDSSIVSGKKLTRGNFDKRLMNPLEALVRLASRSAMDNMINSVKNSLFTGFDNAVAAGGESAENALRLAQKITYTGDDKLRQGIIRELEALVANRGVEGDLIGQLRNGDPMQAQKAFDDLLVTARQGDEASYEKLLKLAKPRDTIVVKTTTKDYKLQVVYRNGEADIYEIFNDELDVALRAMTDTSLKTIENSKAFQLSKNINKTIASFITTSPAFAVANVIRDSVSGAFNSSFSSIPFWHTAIGAAEILKSMKPFNSLRASANGPNYAQEYVDAGGRIANRVGNVGTDLSSIGPEIGSIEARQGGFVSTATGVVADVASVQAGRAKKGLLNGFAYIQRGVSALESMPRLGEYVLARKAGLDVDTALAASLEVTVNFSRRGASRGMQLLNQNVMFLNAGIQGSYRLIRSFKEQPPHKIAVFMTGLLAFDFMLDRESSKHDQYTGMSDAFKDMNYLIPNRLEDGSLDPDLPFYAIPKSYDIGMLGGVLTSGLRSVNEQSAAPFATAVGRMLDMMNPISGRSLLTPTSIKPLIDLQLNQTWMGSEIVPSYMKTGRFPKNQVRAGTGDLAVSIAQGLLALEEAFRPEGQEGTGWISPIALDFLANAYLAGSLQYVKGALDLMTRDEKKRGERTASAEGTSFITFDPITFAMEDVKRRFQVSFTEGSANVTALYELQNRARAARSAYNDEVKQLEYTLLRDRAARSETRALANMSPLLNSAVKSLANFRVERQRIQNASNFSAEEKRARINMIMKSEQELARRVMYQLESIPSLDVLFDTVWGNRKKMRPEGRYW